MSNPKSFRIENNFDNNKEQSIIILILPLPPVLARTSAYAGSLPMTIGAVGHTIIIKGNSSS